MQKALKQCSDIWYTIAHYLSETSGPVPLLILKNAAYYRLRLVSDWDCPMCELVNDDCTKCPLLGLWGTHGEFKSLSLYSAKNEKPYYACERSLSSPYRTVFLYCNNCEGTLKEAIDSCKLIADFCEEKLSCL